ncbi:hypothetical protein QBC46DRAFT_403423 [Diplogelasinospora grovesii]|uniref:(4-O-methyl)-D-glucuronate--lignin esterase n=1 Tax=Diplogelasinospora grovesii TaxID=303347 RepID=A0AAN6NGQ8_9PEZI|nr:hypothetical protein QBC46DRAFT_403423 [Diplogelasinospora grovesii]
MRFFLALSFAAVVSALPASHGPEFGDDSPLSCARLPCNLELVNQTYILPDPFHSIDGEPVTTLADWSCRATQIRALFQKYELGVKPPRPPVLTSTVSSSGVNVTAGDGTKSVTFSASISYPPSGTAPYPAIIAYDGLNVPRPAGAVIITLNVDTIAQQNGPQSRGVGVFYDLYGKDHSAGALMAWAWAVSRIMDVLEATSANINPRRIAVTGCSRNGKGAMVAGAFDQRIALTIPQESGSGGDACWRVSRAMLVKDQLATQTAWEIVGEDVWFSTNFNQFATDNYTVGLLPVDHHELAGLIAPRGLYSTENVGFLWLGAQSNWECMTAANKIYQALGVADRQGFSQDGPHDHCSFPYDQTAEIQAFYDRFLFGKEDTNTSVFRTVGNWTYDESWQPWSVPELA